MRKINNMDLVASAAVEIANYKKWINEAETEERAKAAGNAALGFLNGMNITINAMICTENNDFTGDFGEWVDEQERAIKQFVKQKCIDLICKKDNE